MDAAIMIGTALAIWLVALVTLKIEERRMR